MTWETVVRLMSRIHEKISCLQVWNLIEADQITEKGKPIKMVIMEIGAGDRVCLVMMLNLCVNFYELLMSTSADVRAAVVVVHVFKSQDSTYTG